jgi:hypothetical protein
VHCGHLWIWIFESVGFVEINLSARFWRDSSKSDSEIQNSLKTSQRWSFWRERNHKPLLRCLSAENFDIIRNRVISNSRISSFSPRLYFVDDCSGPYWG